MTRLLLGLAALLACGVIAAGCGDDNDDNGDDSPAATESAPADTTGDVDSVEEAVAACKENVQSTAQQLSEELRGELEDLCDKAASGDEEDVREAALEACKKVIEETVPEGAGRDQALEACENSG
jgi:predicted outer membrane protein